MAKADEEKFKAKVTDKSKTKPKTRAKKPWTPKLDEEGNPIEKKSVQEIVVERLIAKIQSEKRLPWQKPFQTACMNWYSEREYIGVNKLLLSGGEYITFNQLMLYNKSKKTDFTVKGLAWEIVVFYSKREKVISNDEAQKIIKSGFGRTVKPTDKGWVKLSWFLKYFRVYNISLIPPDSEGNKLQSKIGVTVFEEHTPAEAIIEKYLDGTGVKIIPSGDGAWYQHRNDSVGTPDRTAYKSQEAFYRVIFHELIHSTGIKSRLDRQCFHDYHMGSKDRSREELIAEVGGLLLASEAGFRDDTEWADNSMEYLHSWCIWMKDNQTEVLNGMLSAEKAKNFILNGGVKEGEAPKKEGHLAAETEDEPDESVADDGEAEGEDEE
jgi:antirestriction protein ArdC